MSLIFENFIRSIVTMSKKGKIAPLVPDKKILIIKNIMVVILILLLIFEEEQKYIMHIHTVQENEEVMKIIIE